MGSSASRSHVEIRNDDGSVIRLSFFKIIVAFMLCLTTLMIVSGITIMAATSWLVGSVLILPALLLMCITGIVAFSILSRRRGHLSADSEDPSSKFPDVGYSRLAQQVDESAEQMVKLAVEQLSPARSGASPAKSAGAPKKNHPNVSFQE